MSGLFLDFPQHFLDHALGRDSCQSLEILSIENLGQGYLTSVVTAWEPQGGLALLAVVADHQVLEGIAKGVTHTV